MHSFEALPVQRDVDRSLAVHHQVDVVRRELEAESCMGARGGLLAMNGPRAPEGDAVRGYRCGRVIYDRLIRLDRCADFVAETLVTDVALWSNRLVGRRLVRDIGSGRK